MNNDREIAEKMVLEILAKKNEASHIEQLNGGSVGSVIERGMEAAFVCAEKWIKVIRG